MLASNVTVSDTLDRLFSRETGIYGSLEELPLAWQKGHYRRAEILEALNIGDVTGMVCVDFGCGSWGFADIYPKLHMCKFAYGLDISNTALEQSVRLTHDRKLPYWNRCRYLKSDGLDLPLEDQSVDLIFGGEAIEHVRFPRRFLAECYRSLRPGGQLVLTTPNRDALLYRIQGDIYGNWSEHFWLCNWPELKAFVSEFFDIEEVVGFNGSIYRDSDKTASDPAATELWSRVFKDTPELATGIVLRAVKKNSSISKRYRMNTIPDEEIVIKGPRQILETGLGLKGIMIDSPSSSIEFTCPAGSDGVVLAMWAHAWSGFGTIEIGERTEQRSFWAKDPGWRPLLYMLDGEKDTRIRILAKGIQDQHSLSPQVIFCEAFTYVE